MLLFSAAALAQNAEPELKPVQHEFVIKNFKTESGVVLPEAHVVYGTFGTLNASGDNAVLLPSHYMADMNGYGWVIGPAKALDPGKLFLVTSELFGNGRSSSPSNTPEPFHGPKFPITTIRDNVNAVHALLDSLHVKHLKAVIGFSMGAQQAFQWAVSYPDYMDRIVATSGTAKTYGHGIVRLEGQISAITADSAFNGGNYTDEPARGISAFGMVWAGWLFSQEWWRQKLWRTAPNHFGKNFDEVIEHFRSNFVPGADANNLILQMRTWEKHDVGGTPTFHGDVEAALRSIKVPVLYMPSETDLYFPVTDARYEAKFIPHCTLAVIPSLWGHIAGAAVTPEDGKFINDHVSAFMAENRFNNLRETGHTAAPDDPYWSADGSPDSKYDILYSTLQSLNGEGFSNVIWALAESPVVTGHTTATAKSVEGIRKLLRVLVCAKIDSIDGENVPEGFNPKSAPKLPSSLGSPPQEPIRYESWTVVGCGRNMKILIQLWYDVSGNEQYSVSPPPDWLGGA